MTQPCHRLFVYGTLKRCSPHPMAQFLAQRGRFLGEARMPGRLFDLGRYPGMQPAQSAEEWVYGDLYDLSHDPAAWAELDAYENVESPRPSFFERALETVTDAEGHAAEAHVYWFVGDVSHAKRIDSGRYMEEASIGKRRD
ncbi:MAG: gamma-glutamylcyclotransferase [Gemmataceae bacterium]|nr:gamma-glutamylcyclotransferase [Gemmataceae bacterium]